MANRKFPEFPLTMFESMSAMMETIAETAVRVHAANCAICRKRYVCTCDRNPVCMEMCPECDR
jgi:hypothetical protein